MLKRRWMRNRLLLAAAVALLAAACSSGDDGGGAGNQPAAAAGGGIDEVCAAAANEGKLVYWNNLENPDPIFEAFNEAYPDIEIESLQLRPDDSAQRVLAEHAAGRKVSADIIYGGQDVFGSVISEGLIDTTIDWKTLGIADDLVTDSNMVRIYRVAAGLAFNTDKTSAEQLPNTWDELIDAKWAGQVIVDPRGRPFDQLSLIWGEEKALDYVQRLKDIVKPVVIEGGTAGLVAVAGGEALITTGGRSAEVQEQKAKGAPIEIKYLDIVPTLDAYHAVLKDAPHPNAARCWTAWTATAGAAIHQESEIKTNETTPPNTPAGAEISAIDTPEKATQVADMSKKVGDLLQ
jgi:iron(III) transport system substrate-binding protein